ERSDGGGGILAIVRAAQRGDSSQIGNWRRLAIVVTQEPCAVEADAILDRRLGYRNTCDLPALFPQFAGNGLCDVVIDSDNGEVRLFHKPRFDCSVILHCAMPVEVV